MTGQANHSLSLVKGGAMGLTENLKSDSSQNFAAEEPEVTDVVCSQENSGCV